jgi:hypothetical protein
VEIISARGNPLKVVVLCQALGGVELENIIQADEVCNNYICYIACGIVNAASCLCKKRTVESGLG